MKLNRKQILQLIALFIPIIAGAMAWFIWGQLYIIIIAVMIGGILSAILKRYANSL